MSPKRFVLDSMVYDRLVESSDRERKVIAAHEAGKLVLLMTHIQHDELMQDEQKRHRTLAIPFEVTSTYGVVLGKSKLGLARFGEPERIHAVSGGSINHVNDALIAATAKYENAVLVTDDKRLRRRAESEGIDLWGSEEFLAFLNAL